MDEIAARPTPKAVKEILDHPPRTLWEAYDLSMARIMEASSSKVGLELLYTLCIAKAALTLTQVECLINIRPPNLSLDSDDWIDSQEILSSCTGLVMIDPESKIVRFAHETTQTYLLDIYATKIEEAKPLFVMKCLTYLQFPHNSLEFWSEDHVIDRLIHQYPFLEYAAIHWGDHAREVMRGQGNTSGIGSATHGKINSEILKLFRNDGNLACAVRTFLFKTSLQFVHLYKFGGWGAEKRTKGKLKGINQAACFGLDHIIAQLIEEDPQVCIRSGDPFGNVLHWAARGNHELVLRQLLSQPDVGKIINQHSELAHTPLHMALVNRNTLALEMLLENGADPTIQVNRPDPHWNSLQIAVSNRSPNHVRILMQTPNAAELLWQRDVLGQLAINTAADSNDTESMRILLPFYSEAVTTGEHSVDDIRSNFGQTPLHHAAQRGHESATEALLEHHLGQEFIQKLNYQSLNPFELAASTGRLNVLKVFFRLCDRDYLLAQYPSLRRAASRGQSEVVDELLNFFGDLPNASQIFQETLISAAESTSVETVQVVARQHTFAKDDPAIASALVKAESQKNLEMNHYLRSLAGLTDPSESDTTSYPSPKDVFQVALALSRCLGFQRDTLPVVNWILELAEYWLQCKSQREKVDVFDNNSQNAVYLRSQPVIGRTLKPVRRIVLRVTTHDQSSGSGPGTYDQSYTWIAFQKQSGANTLAVRRVITNKTHRGLWTTQTISWPHRPGFDRGIPNCDSQNVGPWLNGLSPGDRVLVIPRADFQAWYNYVQDAQIIIYTTCLRKVIYRPVKLNAGPQLALSFAL